MQLHKEIETEASLPALPEDHTQKVYTHIYILTRPHMCHTCACAGAHTYNWRSYSAHAYTLLYTYPHTRTHSDMCILTCEQVCGCIEAATRALQNQRSHASTLASDYANAKESVQRTIIELPTSPSQSSNALETCRYHTRTYTYSQPHIFRFACTYVRFDDAQPYVSLCTCVCVNQTIRGVTNAAHVGDTS